MRADRHYRRHLQRAIAHEGARIGARMTRLYAGAFIVYATVRVAIAIIEAPAEGIDVIPTVVASGASMVVASVTITTLLALFSTLVGAVSAIAVHWLLVRSAARGVRARPVVVGALVSLISLAVGQIGLLPALGFSPLSLPLGTYLFWIGFPSVIYIVVTTWLGRPLWRHAHDAYPAGLPAQ
jgi:hypothetical protein